MVQITFFGVALALHLTNLGFVLQFKPCRVT